MFIYKIIKPISTFAINFPIEKNTNREKPKIDNSSLLLNSDERLDEVNTFDEKLPNIMDSNKTLNEKGGKDDTIESPRKSEDTSKSPNLISRISQCKNEESYVVNKYSIPKRFVCGRKVHVESPAEIDFKDRYSQKSLALLSFKKSQQELNLVYLIF